MKINQKKLKNKIATIKGNSFVGLTTITEAAQVKNPYGKIQKLSRHLVNVGFSYENAVNNQAKRENVHVKFKPHARVWGEHETQSLIVRNRSKLFFLGLPRRQVAEQQDHAPRGRLRVHRRSFAAGSSRRSTSNLEGSVLGAMSCRYQSHVRFLRSSKLHRPS